MYTAFIDAVKAQSVLFGEGVNRDVAIVYSPLNGTGLKPVTRTLKEMGYNVINPAAIDDAIPVECMSYEEIMRIDLELLSTADYLVQLPGWERSIGASRELGFALGTDKIIVSLEQLLTKEVTLS